MGYPKVFKGVVRKIGQTIYTFSCDFTRFDRIPMGARMSLIKTSNEPKPSFVVYAAVPYNETIINSVNETLVKDNVLQAGQSFVDFVSHVIIPDTEHTMAVAAYKKQHPSIKIIGMEGCNDEINSIIDYKFTDAMGGKLYGSSELKEELGVAENAILNNFEFVYVPSHVNKELVMYYKPEKTLFEADLLMNFQANEATKLECCDTFCEQWEGKSPFVGFYGWIGKLLFVPGSFTNNLLASKTFSDVSGAQKALQTIHKWDIEKIIVCHGDNIVRNGSSHFRERFATLLG